MSLILFNSPPDSAIENRMRRLHPEVQMPKELLRNDSLDDRKTNTRKRRFPESVTMPSQRRNSKSHSRTFRVQRLNTRRPDAQNFPLNI